MSEALAPNFSLDLSGEVALVTGATAGLGHRFAQILAGCGAKVAITGRRAERLDALAGQIRAAGGECEPIVMDMTSREQIRAGLAQAESALGTITILVNNAGVPDAQRATRIDDALFDQVMNTNLEGPWFLSCAVAAKLMKEKRPGKIVNIASMAAFMTQATVAQALYSTTKGALVRMTESLAVEWAKFNINVNAIAPGTFSSEMVDGMMERVGDFSGAFPRKRIGTPDQLDSTLLFLVSPSSECVTGTCIKVDDGQMGR
ncbi:MAG: SDR family NAD(P)-dependent oxidoreductase [Myxococcota bacterium]